MAYDSSLGVRGWNRPASMRSRTVPVSAVASDEGHRGVARPVHRHEVAAADELVELEHVDVPALAGQRRVHDDEGVVLVAVHRGDEVPFPTGLHDHRVGMEPVAQDRLGRVVELGDVHPDEPVVALQQGVELRDVVLLEPGVGHPPGVHHRCGPTGAGRASGLSR